jgi:hypothetical protein
MSTALLVGVIVVAALACPAMMWWQSRRGGPSCCGSAGHQQRPPCRGAELRRRQEQLGARIAEPDRSTPALDVSEPRASAIAGGGEKERAR